VTDIIFAVGRVSFKKSDVCFRKGIAVSNVRVIVLGMAEVTSMCVWLDTAEVGTRTVKFTVEGIVLGHSSLQTDGP
jgi:hypothetical protein